MFSKYNLALPFITVLAMAVSGNASAATRFFATTPHGMIVVNQTTGSITNCSGLLQGGANKPIGKCKVIGMISTVNLDGNIQVSVGSTTNLVAFITNTATGQTIQCGLMVNGTTGIPLGGCNTIQLE